MTLSFFQKRKKSYYHRHRKKKFTHLKVLFWLVAGAFGATGAWILSRHFAVSVSAVSRSEGKIFTEKKEHPQAVYQRAENGNASESASCEILKIWTPLDLEKILADTPPLATGSDSLISTAEPPPLQVSNPAVFINQSPRSDSLKTSEVAASETSLQPAAEDLPAEMPFGTFEKLAIRFFEEATSHLQTSLPQKIKRAAKRASAQPTQLKTLLDETAAEPQTQLALANYFFKNGNYGAASTALRFLKTGESPEHRARAEFLYLLCYLVDYQTSKDETQRLADSILEEKSHPFFEKTAQLKMEISKLVRQKP